MWLGVAASLAVGEPWRAFVEEGADPLPGVGAGEGDGCLLALDGHARRQVVVEGGRRGGADRPLGHRAETGDLAGQGQGSLDRALAVVGDAVDEAHGERLPGIDGAPGE